MTCEKKLKNSVYPDRRNVVCDVKQGVLKHVMEIEGHGINNNGQHSWHTWPMERAYQFAYDNQIPCDQIVDSFFLRHQRK